MNEIPRSAQKVQAAARSAGLDIRIVEMAASTRTAEEAAAACGCQVAQIVKSLIFLGRDSGRPYLLLVSGANRVNEERLAAHIGEGLSRPDANAVRELTGYVIGGVPPIGHPRPMTTLIDEKLLGFDLVWAAAGTPRCVFAVDPRALGAAAAATPLAF